MSRLVVWAAVAGCLMLLPACDQTEAAGPAGQKAKNEEPPVPVVLGKAELHVFPRRVLAHGNVLPEKKVTILPKLPGVLEELGAEVGDEVPADHVLARLDDSDLKIGLKQAKAAVAQAQAGRAQAKVNARNAAKSLKRFQGLYQAKAIPAADFEKVEMGQELAEAGVRVANAGLNAARVAVEQVEKRLEDTVVKAPFAGIVAMRFKDVGEMAAPQTPLYVIADMDPAKVDAGLAETDAALISKGDKVGITLDAFPGETFDGTVERIDPSVDPVSRTVTVRVTRPNTDKRFKMGMAAAIAIDLGRTRHLAVPREGVVIDGVGRGHVFVVGEGDRAKRRDIKLIEEPGAWLKVTHGLKEEERIVVVGARGLSEGARLEFDGQPKEKPRDDKTAAEGKR